MAESLDRLQIEIEANATGAVRSINSLTKSFEKMKGMVAGGLGINKVSSELSELASSLSRIGSLSNALNGFKSLASTMRQLEKSPSALSYIHTFLAEISQLDFSNMRDLSSALTGINEAVRGVERVGNASSGVQRTAKAVKDVGDEAKKSSGFLGDMAGSLKRIAMYRLLRTIIKEVMQALKEGLENAYEYSKSIGSNLANVLDKTASKFQKIKNQLGIAVGELIEGFEPFIMFFMDWLAQLAKTITAVISAIGAVVKRVYEILKPFLDFLWEYGMSILRLIEAIFGAIGALAGDEGFLIADDVSKAWKEATKAAKEYKRTLIGIDEINRLNGESGAGSATGSYTPITPSSGGGNWQIPNLDGWLLPFKQSLQEATEMVFAFNAALATVSAPQLELGLDTDPAYQNLDWFNRTIFTPFLQKSPFILTLGLALNGDSFAAIEVAKTIIGSLMKQSPYIVNVGADTATATESVQGFADVIGYLLQKSPYIVTIEAEAKDPSEILDEFVTAFETATQRVGQTFSDMQEVVKENNAKVSENIETVMKNAKEDVTDFMKEAPEIVKKKAPSFLSEITTAFLAIATHMNPGFLSAKRKIGDFLTDVYTNFENFGTAAGELFGGLWQRITDTVQNIKNWFASAKETTVWKILFGESNSNGFMGVESLIPLAPMTTPPFVPAFASGGFPENGELYLAREAGPEMVGMIGNRNAVANNDQIVEGISEGVAYANSGVIGAINQLIAVVQQIDPTVELDGLKVSRELHKYNRQVTREAGQSLAVEVMA